MESTTNAGSGVVSCPGCGRRNRLPAAATGAPACGACDKALPWLVHAGDADFDRIAVQTDLPVLVDLWAPWCGPCHAIAPHVEHASRTFAGRLKVVKVNVDDAQQIAQRFSARSIPTLVLLEHGQLLSRQVGAVGYSHLERWIGDALAEPRRESAPAK